MWTLVTGGAKRLGAEICLELAKSGHKVIVHYKSSKKQAIEVAEKCRRFGTEAEIIEGSFDSFEEIEAFIITFKEHFSSLSALINNVGNYVVSPLLDTETKNWQQLFQLNVHAPFLLTKAFAPMLIEAGGSVVNMGVSGLLKNGVNTFSPAYYLAKDCLWNLTRTCALELSEKNVRVNMVSPGMLDISVDLDHFLKVLPMHRPASCLEVIRAVQFLLDPQNSYITGQNIEVAGGLGLK